MLAFAVESMGARLAAMRRLNGQFPYALLDTVADRDARQELLELLALRNVLTHIHIWRVEVAIDEHSAATRVEETEPLHGDRTTRLYEAAADASGQRTKRLRLHLVPTMIRRLDVHMALRCAINVFDHLAVLDLENMPSLADHHVKIQGQVRQLRAVDVHHRT